MPSKTLADRVLELERLVTDLIAQIRFSAEAIDGLKTKEAKAAETVNDLRRESERDIAVLKEKVAKLEASRGKAGDRAWSVVPNIVGALIAAVVAFLVARYGK